MPLAGWTRHRLTLAAFAEIGGSAIGLVAIAGLLVRFVSWMYFVGPFLYLHGADAADAVIYAESIYYPTYTRLDGLLIGVTLASIRFFDRPGGAGRWSVATAWRQAVSP